MTRAKFRRCSLERKSCPPNLKHMVHISRTTVAVVQGALRSSCSDHEKGTETAVDDMLPEHTLYLWTRNGRLGKQINVIELVERKARNVKLGWQRSEGRAMYRVKSADVRRSYPTNDIHFEQRVLGWIQFILYKSLYASSSWEDSARGSCWSI